MARFITALLVIAFVIGGVGWYRGWFQFGTSQEGDKTNINISVDKEKIREDEKGVQERLRNIGNKGGNKIDEIKKDKVGSEPPKD